jgi:hypothetical protein
MDKPVPLLRIDAFKNLRLYSTFGSWFNQASSHPQKYAPQAYTKPRSRL